MKFAINYNNPLMDVAAYERDRLLFRQDMALFKQPQEHRETNQVKRKIFSPENEGPCKRQRSLFHITREKFFENCARTMSYQEIGYYAERAREKEAFNEIEDLMLIVFLKTGDYS